MNPYTLHVLNEHRISILRPDDAQRVPYYLQTAQENPKHPEVYSLRLERLAQQLVQHFPLPESGGQAEQAACLWLAGDPVREVREKPCSAIWSPQIDPSRAQEFLQVLLPKARALFLDVIDPSTGIFYGSDGLDGMVTLPAERASERLKLDPAYKTPLSTKPQLRKHCIRQLTLMLAEHGFKAVTDRDYPVYFERDIEGGQQIVAGVFERPRFDQRASFSVRSRSIQDFRIYYAARGEVENLSRFRESSTFYNSLRDFRIRSQREWIYESSDQALGEEDLDWMMSDIVRLGLPVLEKAKTVEGMDWLCHADSDEARAMYECNSTRPINHPRDALAFMSRQIIYAWLSGNPRFEEIIARLHAHASGKHNTPQDPDYKSPRDMAEIEMYAAYCRQSVPRIGTGPA